MARFFWRTLVPSAIVYAVTELVWGCRYMVRLGNVSPDQSRTEIFELTGLRGVAALMVVLFHLNMDVADHFGSIYSRIAGFGFLGVDIFFILSGFVISR
jgi:peptidoglycan/LPS O-acetylase OafA/YrhL